MPAEIISEAEQQSIIDTIQAMCSGDQCVNPDERRQLLFTGVYIALKGKTPPHWVLNIMSHRTDRLIQTK